MQLDVWHIDGTSFHLGKHGLEQEESAEHLGSDSLFAAIVARLVALRGSDAARKFVETMQQDVPPLVFSSAFPRAGAVCLFPAPMELPREPKPNAPKYKELKRCKYVSQSIFTALCAGDALVDWYQHDDVLKLQKGSVLLAPSEVNALPKEVRADKKIWTIDKRPRVTVGRAASNSQIYFTGATVFQKECGLWFGVRWLDRDEETARLLGDALADLGDAGLGGERNAGFGQCKIETRGTMELPDAEGAYWVSLSRYLPRQEEMDALRNGMAYSIANIGGWVLSQGNKSQRRRAVRVLNEGSVLGQVARTVPGEIVDVQPNYQGTEPFGHPVWRSGRALAVGVKRTEAV